MARNLTANARESKGDAATLPRRQSTPEVTKSFAGKPLRILASPSLFLPLIHVPPDRVYTVPVVIN
jgi:hypothetical protein